ncbi:hypothetical protein NQD34_008864 [Periophthalmus magnuspinnatus]|nr:hypothetical protein NQD34_008864 [Periophthalmus magnuspinnatus]
MLRRPPLADNSFPLDQLIFCRASGQASNNNTANLKLASSPSPSQLPFPPHKWLKLTKLIWTQAVSDNKVREAYLIAHKRGRNVLSVRDKSISNTPRLRQGIKNVTGYDLA